MNKLLRFYVLHKKIESLNEKPKKTKYQIITDHYNKANCHGFNLKENFAVELRFNTHNTEGYYLINLIGNEIDFP